MTNISFIDFMLGWVGCLVGSFCVYWTACCYVVHFNWLKIFSKNFNYQSQNYQVWVDECFWRHVLGLALTLLVIQLSRGQTLETICKRSRVEMILSCLSHLLTHPLSPLRPGSVRLFSEILTHTRHSNKIRIPHLQTVWCLLVSVWNIVDDVIEDQW